MHCQIHLQRSFSPRLPILLITLIISSGSLRLPHRRTSVKWLEFTWPFLKIFPQQWIKERWDTWKPALVNNNQKEPSSFPINNLPSIYLQDKTSAVEQHPAHVPLWLHKLLQSRKQQTVRPDVDTRYWRYVGQSDDATASDLQQQVALPQQASHRSSTSVTGKRAQEGPAPGVCWKICSLDSKQSGLEDAESMHLYSFQSRYLQN